MFYVEERLSVINTREFKLHLIILTEFNNGNLSKIYDILKTLAF